MFGYCFGCGRWKQINADGRLIKHGAPLGPRECVGSLKRPLGKKRKTEPEVIGTRS